MNIGIIIISGTVFFWALYSLYTLRKNKEKPKWVIKAQSLAALLAMAWAIIDFIEEVWRSVLSDMALSYMKLYGSIIFGLCLGILLTLKLAGQLQKSEEQLKTK
ncbi:MAG: hypothetical protein M0Z60_12330 [Nitrospiraceae bacterium]|nr:hypothetical protein [Nitrospiraceae bacterium]